MILGGTGCWGTGPLRSPFRRSSQELVLTTSIAVSSDAISAVLTAAENLNY